MRASRRRTTQSSALDPSSLERRLEGLNRLLHVTRRLAAEVDLSAILSTIAEEVCNALDCDRATVYQYDAENNELYTLVVTELELAEIRKPADGGISGFSATHRQVVNVADPHGDDRWDSSVDRATGYTTHSILAAPLVAAVDGKLLGVLQLLNKRSGPFDQIDEELLTAFSQHAAVALDRARLVAELQRQGKVQASLGVARDIQRGFMPDQLPEIPGYEVATWWYPNEAVGGDYCDVYPLRDGRTCLVIADVSGHGLGPSLIMASARAALRALCLGHSSTEVLLSLLGHSLSVDLQDGKFITAVLAALDSKNHRIEFANAGHAPALYYNLASDSFTPLESTGLPLGVLDRPEFPQGPPIQMAVGDLLVLCTDGIVESMNDDNEQFGTERLQQIVRAMARSPLSELVHEVGRQVSSHYVGDSPPDDLTILALRRNM